MADLRHLWGDEMENGELENLRERLIESHAECQRLRAERDAILYGFRVANAMAVPQTEDERRAVAFAFMEARKA